MPGLSGVLGSTADQIVLESGFASLAVAGVRNGRVTITHTGATSTGYGAFHGDGGVAVAFWGEFYGEAFRDAADGGAVAQTLAECFRRDGVEKALRSLDGSFALFVQLADGTQILAADRVASRPVFYRVEGDCLYFAPHPRITAPAKPLDEDTILSFVVNGHPLWDRTYFRDVRLLRPAHLLRRASGTWSASEYRPYVVCDPDAKDLGMEAYAEALAPVLRGALRRQSRYLDTAVVPISGGFDSRGLLAGIREFYDGPLTTVSWGIHEDDPQADAAIGRRVAAQFQTNHHFLRRRKELVSQDLPEVALALDLASDDCLLHHHEPTLIRWIRHELGCRVLFRGDECFGYGGPADSAYEALGRISVMHVGHYGNLQSLLHPGSARRRIDEQRATYDAIVAGCPYRDDWTAAKDWLYLQQRVFRSLNASHYAKLSILEARNPWLDGSVFDFFAGVPLQYRIDKVLYRHTLTRMFPGLMRDVPMAERNSLEDWGAVLRSDSRFRALVDSRLFAGDSPLFAIFDRAALRRAVEAYFAAPPQPSWTARAIETGKRFLRANAGSIYRALKKTAAPKLSIREFPAHLLVGRCLSMRIWLDRNA